MKKERLKELLYNAVKQFAYDEYSKETVLYNLDMTEQEFEELTKEFGELSFMEY